MGKPIQEAMKLLDAKYDPIIRQTIKEGFTTVRQIAEVINMEPATTWRMMRRLGFKPNGGWRKAR